MSLLNLSESTSGLGDVSGLLAWSVYVGETLEGVGSLQGTVQQTFLVGGQVRGVGTLSDELLSALGGRLEGSGDVSGYLIHQTPFRGIVRGLGNLRDSVPLPLAGFGTLRAYVEVAQVAKPVCSPDTRQRFGFQSLLGPNSLTLRICDAKGNPYDPPSVSYAIYEVLAGGYRQLRGPPRRTPVRDGVGRYHATGYVGECGQPGTWVVVWSWMGANGCATWEEEFVLEAGKPLTNSCAKYGWD